MADAFQAVASTSNLSADRPTLKPATLLRVFIGELARHHSLPLYEAIVLKAREMHLAGATVLRGPLGFGHTSRLHTMKILRLSEDLPVVIEIVDEPEKIDAFLPVLDGMITGGLVTLEQVQILYHGSAETLSKAASAG
ncbi:MAG: DUF190 domain-containing protein [Alphaproteobacteria bacterium]|nr:DUF190 domain-containing protein [Alphaproteobacteria bacterium]